MAAWGRGRAGARAYLGQGACNGEAQHGGQAAGAHGAAAAELALLRTAWTVWNRRGQIWPPGLGTWTSGLFTLCHVAEVRANKEKEERRR